MFLLEPFMPEDIVPRERVHDPGRDAYIAAIYWLEVNEGIPARNFPYYTSVYITNVGRNAYRVHVPINGRHYYLLVEEGRVWPGL